MQALPRALRIVRLAALAGAAAAFTGCAVYAYPEPAVVGPGPGVVYAPAPVVIGAPVYVGPRVSHRGYRGGHGHGHGHRSRYR